MRAKLVLAGEATLNGVATVERSRDEVIEALVREHSRMVYRIAYASLRSHHDAEDATQETFLRALRYSTKLDEVEDAKAWLARIAWRTAVERGRKTMRAREVSLDDEADEASMVSRDVSAEEKTAAAQIGSVLEKMIARLPEKLRGPLILSTVEEMSTRDVAAVLGTSEAAVRSRVFRARQILKERLESSGRWNR